MASAGTGRGPKYQSAGGKIDLFRITLNSGFEVVVPDNEVLTELPNGAKEGCFFTVTCPQGPRYIHKGRVFQEEYFKRFQGAAYEQVEDRVAEQTKGLKEVKETQRDTIELLFKAKDKVEQRAIQAEKERDSLRKDLKAWQNAYHVLQRRADRLDYEGDRDYHLRLLSEGKAKEELDNMANKVMELQSGMEEVRIAEAELVSGFKQLCSKIGGCMNLLKFHIPDTQKQNLENLRPLLGFESSATLELSFIDNALAKYLLDRILSAVELNFLHGLGQWSTLKNDIDDNDSLTALLALEKDMQKRILRLAVNEEEINPKMSAKAKKAAAAARAESIHITQSYYRWRSETTRLHQSLKNTHAESRRTDENAAKNVTNRVCTDFFALMMQIPPEETDFYPSRMFMVDGIVGLDDAEKRFEGFQFKVRNCVDTAMQLFSKMRSGRAQYIFDWIPAGRFQLYKMEINEAQRASISEKALNRLGPLDVEVAYCVFPAFVKFGDDYGQGYHRQRVLKQADVIVEGLPQTSQSKPGKLMPRESPETQTEARETSVRTGSVIRRLAESNGNGHKADGDDESGKGRTLWRPSMKLAVPWTSLN